MKKPIFIVALAIVAATSFYFLYQSAPKASPDKTEAEKEQPVDQTIISAEAAAKSGIETDTVKPARIEEAVSLTGRINLNQNTTIRIKARFPGIVREVTKGLGDAVRKGEVLARVESNDSLLTYSVIAPTDGVVLDRQTNVGDVAGDAPLFTIVNLSDVWAEFYVFSSDIPKISAGLPVRIATFGGSISADSRVASLLPLAEASSQAMLARVTLPNAAGRWRVGMTVKADVVIADHDVPLAVKTTAIQQQQGQAVVYVQEGDTYRARKVELGLADDQKTEVRNGLQAGERYVTANSFIIKADIGKSGAEDED